MDIMAKSSQNRAKKLSEALGYSANWAGPESSKEAVAKENRLQNAEEVPKSLQNIIHRNFKLTITKYGIFDICEHCEEKMPTYIKKYGPNGCGGPQCDICKRKAK